MAIVGLPPLNGFVSEWVAVQGLLAGAREPGLPALLVLGVTGLGLIGALALACFSRAAGGVFLGQQRHPRAPVQDQWGLVGPMLALAAACLLVGLVPNLAVQPALATTMALITATGAAMPVALPLALPAAAHGLGWLWIGMVALALGAWYLRRRAAQAAAGASISATWGCAYAAPTSRMQYTAGSFAAPLLLAFGKVAVPEVIRAPGVLETRSRDRVLDGLVRPLWRRATTIAAGIRPLQQGPVTRYLQYIVLTVLLLLAALFVSFVRQP